MPRRGRGQYPASPLPEHRAADSLALVEIKPDVIADERTDTALHIDPVAKDLPARHGAASVRDVVGIKPTGEAKELTVDVGDSPAGRQDTVPARLVLQERQPAERLGKDLVVLALGDDRV